MGIIQTDNPLIYARRLGRSVFGRIGGEIIENLEVCYCSRLLPDFLDNPYFRLNQNALLMWAPSFYKSTLLLAFSKTIPANLGIIDISSQTVETLYGSLGKEGNFIEPALVGKSFVIVTELSAFLGSGLIMRNMVNLLNVALEGQPITRRLLKLVQPYRANIVSELSKKGILWNPKEGTISYVPRASFIVGTRPLPNKVYTYLKSSGFFSRFLIEQYDFTDEELIEDFHVIRRIDREAIEKLKEINLRLSQVSVRKLVTPSATKLDDAFSNLEELARNAMIDNRYLRLSDVLNPRIKDNVIRHFVSYAFLRSAVNNGFRHLDEIQYSQEDLNYIIKKLPKFLESTINPLFVEDLSPRLAKARPKKRTKEIMLTFLHDGRERSRKEILAHVCPK